MAAGHELGEPLKGRPGAIALLGVLLISGLLIRTGFAAPPQVSIYGQFGENRYAASEAMRRLQGILDLVYAEAGVPFEYVSVPFNRAYHQVMTHTDSCLSAVTRTAETERDFRWMFPVTESRILVIVPALSDRPDPPPSLDGLRQHEAEGIVSLDGAGQTLLEKAGIPHDSRPAADTVVKMVAAGRVRFGVLLSVTYDHLDIAEKKSVRVLGVLEAQTIWHACNTILSPAQVDPLIAAWDRLYRDGRLAKLYADFNVALPPRP